jgi:hypothetical protein
MVESEGEKTNYTEEQLVLRFIFKAKEAKAMKDYHSYFTYFEGAFGMLLAYMPIDVQKDCEADYNDYIMRRYEILNSTLNEDAQKKKLNDLMLNFADTHTVFINKALQYRGWQKPEIEGELDWKDISPDDFAALVRAKKSLNSKEADDVADKTAE